MRQHNKYLEKVYQEMDVYRKHLLNGDELTPTQEETFEKLDICRAWLKDGYSDTEVIRMLKNHPTSKVMERRAREILAMSYEVFAELRQLRNRDGIKYIYAEQFRGAAKMVMEKIGELIGAPLSEDMDFLGVKMNIDTSTIKEVAMLLKEYRGLMKEAATIDGAYDTSRMVGDKKKPTKIVVKRRTTVVNGNVTKDQIDEEAEYEQLD
ncbi:hypothetical protein DR864_27335 [Runella rosea]|uniref:Uncharacterized protein n=1 Tax=Runella rosea TaxID=2259595 RepID=A0A344TRB6_9BACT|nr:hypothetical protein [Runella rosea]AXE21187.1 hypothetical protein DR864_27335 [Runella rosea]